MKKFIIRWIVELLVLIAILASIVLIDINDNIILLIVQCAVVAAIMVLTLYVFNLEKVKLNRYINTSKTQRRRRRVEIAVDNILKSIVDYSVYHTVDNRVYALIEWPFSQHYMNESWFDKEAILYQTINSDQMHRDAAYFIPVNRLAERD